MSLKRKFYYLGMYTNEEDVHIPGPSSLRARSRSQQTRESNKGNQIICISPNV